MSDHQKTLADAIAAHQAGRLKEAEVGYQSVLRTRPSDPDALHFYGLLTFHRGQGIEAVKLIMKSLSHAPENAHAWNNLGNVLLIQGKTTEAKEAYRRATVYAPGLAEAWFNRGVCLREEGELVDAAHHFSTAIAHQPKFVLAYESLGRLLYRCGAYPQAAPVYAAWLKLDPDNVIARHIGAALSGTHAPERADDLYVAKVFDSYADKFDEHLKELGYRAPELVSANLAQHLASPNASVILDAGCGTGLCGPLLRPLCSRLVGVDLSPGMIEKARHRGGYDELVVSELCAYMRAVPGAFDAVVSADTLVYFGALEEVCAAACNALRPGGVFVFTVEALLSDGAVPHELQLNARYAHRDSYLRAVLGQHGFAVLEVRRETLRMERLQDVAGYLVIARKTAT